MSEINRSAFEEVKLWHPIKTVKEWGRRLLNLAGIQETALHRPDHYELTVHHPKPNVSVYAAIHAPAWLVDLMDPDQLQMDFEAQADKWGDAVPDIQGRDIPRMQPPENRWDSEGGYLSKEQ